MEQLQRFAAQPDAEIHLYSQCVRDLLVSRYPARIPGQVIWHRIPRAPGPHLLGYLWWFVANRFRRWLDAHFHGLKFDLLYSPGVNAPDADVISVHIVFAAFYAQVRSKLRLRDAPVSRWPLLLHRRLYYLLISELERRIYPARRVALTTISRHAADRIHDLLGRIDVKVIRYGVDAESFHPRLRTERRAVSRLEFGIHPDQFCLLFIGNDWKNKGLSCLLSSIATLRELKLKLLVVGNDDREPYKDFIRNANLEDVIVFHAGSADVLQFYAAADAYVAPSLEDAYGLPILEAMACGLPVIASSHAGASEVVCHAINGMILREPENAVEFAALIRQLYSNRDLCERLGREGRATAEQETWDRNAAQMWEFLQEAARQKAQSRRS